MMLICLIVQSCTKVYSAIIRDSIHPASTKVLWQTFGSRPREWTYYQKVSDQKELPDLLCSRSSAGLFP